MTAHRTVEELEALLSGELAATELEQTETHLKECAQCQSELAWLRSERALFARRPRTAMSPDLWSRIDARLPAQTLSVVAPPRRARSREFGQWLAVAGTAAAFLIMLSVGGAGALGLRERLRAMFGGTPGGGKVEIKIDADDHPKEDAERTASLQVAGPVTLRLATASADIDAVAGPADHVRIWLSDSDCQLIELQKGRSGEIQALFDRREGLKSGHLRVEVPPLSGLVIHTASGSINCADIGGDLSVDTASGDVHVKKARKLTLNSASGDIVASEVAGPLQIRTVSGDLRLESAALPMANLDVSSVSGEIQIDGLCATGCRIGITTVSGDVRLRMHPQSSFMLSMHTTSGELYRAHGKEPEKSTDDSDDSDRPPPTLKIGSGAGAIDLSTQSADVHLIEG